MVTAFSAHIFSTAYLRNVLSFADRKGSILWQANLVYFLEEKGGKNVKERSIFFSFGFGLFC